MTEEQRGVRRGLGERAARGSQKGMFVTALVKTVFTRALDTARRGQICYTRRDDGRMSCRHWSGPRWSGRGSVPTYTPGARGAS